MSSNSKAKQCGAEPETKVMNCVRAVSDLRMCITKVGVF